MYSRAIFVLFLFILSDCITSKSIPESELRKIEFSKLNTYYAGKDGKGYETPDESSTAIVQFLNGQKIKVLESLSDPRRNLYGWVLVQTESGTKAWVKRETIKAKLLFNEGIGEIYSISKPYDNSGLVSESKLPGENIGLILDLFIHKGEIVSFGPWEKKNYKQFSVSSKEDLRYLSFKRGQTLELGKVRRLDEKQDEQVGCWFGYPFNARIKLSDPEISYKEDLVFKGDIQPKLPPGKIEYGIKNKDQIKILNLLAKELIRYAPKESLGEIPELKCDGGEHCHISLWSLPEKKYLFATLEGRHEVTGKFHSLFLIVSLEEGKEKVVSYLFDQGFETAGRFFTKLTDMDGNGIPEVWVGDQNSQNESYIERIFLLDKDLFLRLGEKYGTGC
ncbi:SH3 domain-containing protein [Leptospira selangorensis]|uniref:SH3 domain-containing protein n=1 Tax=Leptospira selangorensis TaxID=2484982 RepID=UPI001082EF96|nr:SH3 domain-containing protein [Leptospira selangorensis]TGK03487.1 SH3 domain-containing protein [Leptospira selangorensis]